MAQREMKAGSSEFLGTQAAWYKGIDLSMKAAGATQIIDADALVKMQNDAIRECVRAAGNYFRAAMLELSGHSGIYPEELKDDRRCQTMLKKKNATL